jgi:hypothetical protein
LSKALAREQATNQAHEVRIAALDVEVAHYRQQIESFIAGASMPRPQRPGRRRAAATALRSAPPPKKSARKKGKAPSSKKAARTRAPKRRPRQTSRSASPRRRR